MIRLVGSTLGAFVGNAAVRSCRRLSLSCVWRTGKSERLRFASLSLGEDLHCKLQANGYDRMFEIQEKSLPITLKGNDLVGRAETGSGKTLCFTVPVIEKLSRSASSLQPRALMIFPTRELAIQVHGCLKELGPHLKPCLLYGGRNFEEQIRVLNRGCDVVIGTPGRLRSLAYNGHLKLDQIQFLVLDEADELLRPSFYEQVHDLIRGCPSDKQTMLFSATFPRAARSVADSFMREPEYIEVNNEAGGVPASIKQISMLMNKGLEVGLVMHLLEKYKPTSCVLFVSKKISARLLASYLSKIGVECKAIHGDMSQSQREATLQLFRDGRVPVLVGTDVVGRGLDVPSVELVVQIEPPPSGATNHTHRCGRTGRAGRPGTSVVLYYDYQKSLMKDVWEAEPLLTDEPTPELVEDPTKPWTGVLSENFAFGGQGEKSEPLFGRQQNSGGWNRFGGRQNAGGRRQNAYGGWQNPFGGQKYGFDRRNRVDNFNTGRRSSDHSPFHRSGTSSFDNGSLEW